MLEMALIENIQRENLNSLEIAISYKKLIDELKINQENLAKRVGKDRSTINNYLRLLKLPPTIQKGIIENKIQMGHARSLITIETSEMQLEVYKKMLANKLSVRNVENLVRKLSKTKSYRKKISTENFYDAKSAGYSFGTDLAEKELSKRNLHSNIDQFLDELSINYSDLKCNNEG